MAGAPRRQSRGGHAGGGVTLTKLEHGAIVAAVAKMCRPEAHFNVCVVDEACKLLNVTPTTRERQAMSLLHCVNWRDMSEDTRSELLALLSRLFDGLASAMTAEEKAAPPKRGWLRLLRAAP
jgi:hypothetical protein